MQERKFLVVYGHIHIDRNVRIDGFRYDAPGYPRGRAITACRLTKSSTTRAAGIARNGAIASISLPGGVNFRIEIAGPSSISRSAQIAIR